MSNHSEREHVCTDIPCLVIFLVITLATIGLSSLGAASGGTLVDTPQDYEGHPCGEGAPYVLADWPRRKYLWQPLADAVPEGYAVCVTACPRYAEGRVKEAIENYGPLAAAVPSLPVVYDTYPLLNRCLPREPYVFDYETIQEGGLASIDYGVGVLPEAAADLGSATAGIVVGQVAALVVAVVGVAVVAFGGVHAAHCFVGFGASLGVCTTLLLGVVFLMFGVALDGSDLLSLSTHWIAVGVLTMIVAVLSAAAAAFVWDYRAAACRVLAEVGGVVAALPGMMAVPVLAAGATIAISQVVMAGCVGIGSDATQGKTAFLDPFAPAGTNATVRVVSASALTSSSLSPLIAALLIGWLWIVLYIHAFGYMAGALCTAKWFCAPQPKILGCGVVLTAIGESFKYSGTLALGAVLVFPLRLPRTLLRLREGALREGQAAGVDVACGCCMTVLDRTLHRVADSVYAAKAILGTEELPDETDLADDGGRGCAACGFLAASRQLRLIFLRRMPLISVVMFKVNTFVALMKLATSSTTALLTWQLLRVSSLTDTDVANTSALVAAVLCFAVASNAFSLLHGCIDALLMCYACDVQYWGGNTMSAQLRHLADEGELPPLGEDRAPKNVEMQHRHGSFAMAGAVTKEGAKRASDAPTDQTFGSGNGTAQSESKHNNNTASPHSSARHSQTDNANFQLFGMDVGEDPPEEQKSP